MSRPADTVSQRRSIAPRPTGNPEGKGAVGVLRDWQQSEPRGVVAKSPRQVLAEFFTSMLALSANFRYRPAVGIPNYLYRVDGEWLLSLIGPHEWSTERRSDFAGTCVLQRDRTWTIEPSEALGRDNALSAAVAEFYASFVEILDTDRRLEEVLPFYVDKLPYHQRMNANALGRSIRGSLILGDRTSMSCRDWQKQLPGLDRMLLNHSD